MNTIRLQQRGTFTLPKKIRESLNLSEGDILRVSQRDNAIILERPSSKADELLTDIKQSLQDMKHGKFVEFASISEFKKKLKKYDAD